MSSQKTPTLQETRAFPFRQFSHFLISLSPVGRNHVSRSTPLVQGATSALTSPQGECHADAVLSGRIAVARRNGRNGSSSTGLHIRFRRRTTGLINNKAVLEDLKVTEDQATKLKDWGKEFNNKIDEIYKDKGLDRKDFKALFSPDNKEKLTEINAAVSQEAYKQLGDILKKEQIERLKQIERQRMGVNAFSNEEVATALKLTDSQKTSVKGITGDFQKESREIRAEAVPKDKGKGKGKFGGFGFDPETQKKIAKVEKEAIGKVTDLLDDNQKNTWKELVGKEFDLTKLQFVPGKKKDD